MEKEVYVSPSIETILLELEEALVVGSRTTMEVDPIPDNGGFEFIGDE
ncbi:MAG: hypothetical protein J6Y37_00465 [Paludibacteraceae bacterium]|nr:hypothetical protein [Paludibacteraceae bacterium]